MKRQISFYIRGQVYSMKNSHMLTRGRSIKHPKAAQFEKDFMAQVPREYCGMMMGSRDQLLWVKAEIIYPTWKQDLSPELLWDLLQKSQIVSNDRWIRDQHVTGLFVDKDGPGVRISIGEL